MQARYQGSLCLLVSTHVLFGLLKHETQSLARDFVLCAFVSKASFVGWDRRA
jgi:hypothetical protein